MTIRTELTQYARRLLAAGLLTLPGLALAQPSAHYVPGIEGIKAATLPPPGVYLRDYNVGYYATQLNDPRGHEVPGVDATAFVYANVPRLVWITDQQLLGGFLGVDALLPLQYTDLDFKTPGGELKDNKFGIGDFFAEGTWSTHLKQCDFSLGYGIWAPTGDSSPGFSARAGQGFWTHMFTAGATWYPDTEKKWAISALNRYEISSEKDDANRTPGQAYTLEWGLSRALSKTVDVGVAGYYQQQVTTDSGDNSNDARDRVAGIGPEIDVFYPKYMLGWQLRYAYEFMSEDRLQGHTFALTITKRF